MNDPRFEKLPKWAQDQYRADLEKWQITAALRWPTEAKPEPVIRGTGYGQSVGDYEGWAYTAFVSSGFGGLRQERVFIRKDGYRFSIHSNEDGKGRGQSIAQDSYYASEHEALLAARWRFCEEAARALANLDRALLA